MLTTVLNVTNQQQSTTHHCLQTPLEILESTALHHALLSVIQLSISTPLFCIETVDDTFVAHFHWNDAVQFLNYPYDDVTSSTPRRGS